jgi:hypothetical protein
MLSEQVTAINDIPAERIRAVIELADEAFWRTIGRGFPEVTAGDFGPDDVVAWESARNWAVCSWLQYNAPRHGPDKHLGLTPATLAHHIVKDHGEDLADIDTQVDPASYLMKHGVASTGDHGLDVLLVWHEKAHPERSSPAPQASPAGSRQPTRLVVVVQAAQPLADQVVIGHAQQLAETLNHQGGAAFCVTVVDAQGAEVTGWVARQERVHLSIEDLALLGQGDTIEVPYAGGISEAVLSGEEDFTPEQLRQLAGGGEVVISTGRGALRVTADWAIAGSDPVSEDAEPETEEVTAAELRPGDQVVSSGPGTFLQHGPGIVRGKTRSRRGGRQVGWRVSFDQYAPVTWKGDKPLIIRKRT